MLQAFWAASAYQQSTARGECCQDRRGAHLDCSEGINRVQLEAYSVLPFSVG